MWAIMLNGEVYATADTYEEGRAYVRRYGLSAFGPTSVVLLADVAG